MRWEVILGREKGVRVGEAFCPLALFLFNVLLLEREERRKEEKRQFVIPLIDAFIGCFLTCALTGDRSPNLGLWG